MKKINLIIFLAIVFQCNQMFGAARSSTFNQQKQIDLVHKAFESSNRTLLEQYRKEFLDNNIQILIEEALTQIDEGEKKKTLHVATDIADALPTSQKVSKILSHQKIGGSVKEKKDEQYLTCSKEAEKHIRDILFDKNIYPELQNEILSYITEYKHLKKLIHRSSAVFYFDDDPVWRLCELKNGNLVSGSDDSTIKIWDVETGECLKTLTGHTGKIISLNALDNPMGEEHLISLSSDRTVKAWDIQEGACFSSTSNDAYDFFVLKNDRLAYCSSNVTIWCPKTGDCQELKHDSHIHSLTILKNNKLATASSTSTNSYFKIWDLKTGVCLQTLIEPYSEIIKILSLPDDRLVLLKNFSKIEIWDKALTNCLKVVINEDLSELIKDVQVLPNGNLVSLSFNCREIKIWDLKTSECLQTIVRKNYPEYITSMCVLKNGNLALGYSTGHIEILSKGLDNEFSIRSKIVKNISQKLYKLVCFMRLCKRKSA